MADTVLKQKLLQSLMQFSGGNLAESANALLGILGYKSQKRIVLDPNTPQSFLAEFDKDDRFNAKNALLDEWQTVDFLFQLADEEVQSALSSQDHLFANKQVNNTIINSYLFFAIRLRGERYTRTQLAFITREVNKLFPMPALILFQHGEMLTLSIVARRVHKRDQSKDVLEKVTLIKDICTSNPNRAHVEILHDLAIQTLSARYAFTNFVELQRAWEKTLDTSELNKRFYREVANWYFWAKDRVTFPDGAGQDVNTRNATSVIRLITRLIFVWFLKEKRLVPDDFFNLRKLKDIMKFDDPNGSTYYKAILQNLFFATLNQEMNTPEKPDQRKFRGKASQHGGRDQHHLITNLYRYEKYFKEPAHALELFTSIPFLNGGLFECLDKPDKDDPAKTLRVDGFSDRSDNTLVVGDELFFGEEHEIDLNEIYATRNKAYKVRGLVNIFESYKFTIEENTPIEEEIALDPELLGKVFENLLASYNPETGTTARKQTGSFYTPREIVNYMVDESLIAYLETKLGESEESQFRLRHLLEYNNEEPQCNEQEKEGLIEAIDNIKVLDPACGSGAFPMGILHKLVHILKKLDPGNQRWKERQIAKASEIPDATVREKVIEDIEQSFSDNELDYGRKLYLIENCIYGVDIQHIAVQIAKLRFFISLVVDQGIDDAKENRGICPLPNLETKFVAANTLIGIERPQQMMLRNQEIDRKEKELAEIRRRHFDARTPTTKRKYREKDAELRAEISELLKQDGFPSETTRKLAYWNPYDQNSSAGFFNSEWMYGVTGGFDVVIGNPPYLESRHPSFDDNSKDRYQLSTKYRWGDDAKYITRGADLLVYFIEFSIFNINDNGHVVLLTQNSWLYTEYGKRFQNFILRNTQVKKIIDSDFRYFASGGGPNINTVITLFRSKSENPNNTLVFARYHENFEDMSFANLNLSGNENSHSVDIRKIKNNDTLLNDLKWGILLSSPDEVLYLLKVLNKKAVFLNELNGLKLEIGQGLNLTKDYVVDSEFISRFNFASKAKIPFYTSEDGAVFVVNKTQQYLLDRTKLSKKETQEVLAYGVKPFDPNTTNKIPPKLILPRGINRHYCAINLIGSYSASCVDVYDLEGNAGDTIILNLWLFFNSSVFWLIREISGRKNLGGGMLKSEAVDLGQFPIYMDFKRVSEIKDILRSIGMREALTTIQEIDTDGHKKIDEIVFNFLGLSEKERMEIIEILKSKILEREKKAKT